MRVALVTGASKGIGAAIAVALAEAGHAVALGYQDDAQGAASWVRAITQRGGRGIAVQGNVSGEDDVEAMFMAVEAGLGPVQILVNNAGILRDRLLIDMSADDWQQVIAIDLTGPWLCARRGAPSMIAGRWGRIINIGSVAAVMGSAGQANYATAKAGLMGLTRSIAAELASRNVTCNGVLPGPVDTTILSHLNDRRREQLRRQIPIRRFPRPQEVAAVVAFLCSEAAACVTGVMLPVDGGMSMGH